MSIYEKSVHLDRFFIGRGERSSLHVVPLLRSQGTRASTSFLFRFAEPSTIFRSTKKSKNQELDSRV